MHRDLAETKCLIFENVFITISEKVKERDLLRQVSRPITRHKRSDLVKVKYQDLLQRKYDKLGPDLGQPRQTKHTRSMVCLTKGQQV